MLKFLRLKSNCTKTLLDLPLRRLDHRRNRATELGRPWLQSLGLGLISLLWISCASSPEVRTEISDGAPAQMEAKAYLQDLRTGKSHMVNLDILAVKPERARIEVSSSLGIHLASLVITDSKVAYTLNREEKYFEGEKSDRSLVPLLSVPLDPDDLINVVFDAPVKGSNWVCQNENGLIKSCLNEKDNLTVQWLSRQGNKRTVELKSSKFDIKLLFQSVTTKVQVSDSTFALQPPASYKKFRLR